MKIRDNGVRCLSCSLTTDKNQKRVYVSRHWMAEPALDMNLPGFLIVKTKRHIEEASELTIAEAKEMGIVLQKVVAAVRAATNPARVYLLKMGEVVNHFHFWVFPRTSAVEKAIGKGPKAIAQIVQQYKTKFISPSDLKKIRQTTELIRRFLDEGNQRSGSLRRTRNTDAKHAKGASPAKMSHSR